MLESTALDEKFMTDAEIKRLTAELDAITDVNSPDIKFLRGSIEQRMEQITQSEDTGKIYRRVDLSASLRLNRIIQRKE